jgi:hypothetical protein
LEITVDKSPLRVLTSIKANKRRMLVLWPGFVNCRRNGTFHTHAIDHESNALTAVFPVAVAVRKRCSGSRCGSPFSISGPVERSNSGHIRCSGNSMEQVGSDGVGEKEVSTPQHQPRPWSSFVWGGNWSLRCIRLRWSVDRLVVWCWSDESSGLYRRANTLCYRRAACKLYPRTTRGTGRPDGCFKVRVEGQLLQNPYCAQNAPAGGAERYRLFIEIVANRRSILVRCERAP